MSRKANTLSDLNRAPGTFFTLNAIEVLFPPPVPLGTCRRLRLVEAALPLLGLALDGDGAAPFRIRKKRVKLRLSSSMPPWRIFPEYSRAACCPAIAAAS